MIRNKNRSVAKLKSKSRGPDGAGLVTSRLAEVSARIESSRSAAVVRKPLFNRSLDVVAYELIAADGPIREMTVETGDDGVGRIILNSFTEIDLATISDNKPVQLTVMSPVLAAGVPAELDPAQVELILGAGVGVTETTQSAVAELRSRGFRIVLDDFAKNTHLHPLIRHAAAVKINVAHTTGPIIEKQIAILRDAAVDLVADGVASHEELRAATRLGFRHYQGPFLSRPDGFRKSGVSRQHLASLELITLLQNPDVDIVKIAEVIRRDVNLSYRILKVVNSASYSLPRPLGSIEEAVVLLGTQQIVSWVGMLGLSRVSSKPTELTRAAMIRARACESVAPLVGRPDTQRFYLVGLFSVIEALLDAPAQKILGNLPLSVEVVDAITTGNGIMGEALGGVVAFEQADWDRAHVVGVDDKALYRAYRSAVIETDETWAKVSGT